MTALAADHQIEVRGTPTLLEIAATASVTYYKGGGVCLKTTSTATGLVIKNATGESFLGFVYEGKVLGSGGGNVKVMKDAIFLCTFASVAQTDVGKLVYGVNADDSLFSTTSGAGYTLVAGKIVEYVDATHAWVDTREKVA
jgi:hypothetical protein